ncbi:hypothetical protein [Lyngbya aestuarii]|uniref:hypothetical protein n=1 Tax=Lyngbya aestuarii TaxID=118322 RepID=UPI00403DA3AE
MNTNQSSLFYKKEKTAKRAKITREQCLAICKAYGKGSVACRRAMATLNQANTSSPKVARTADNTIFER